MDSMYKQHSFAMCRQCDAIYNLHSLLYNSKYCLFVTGTIDK